MRRRESHGSPAHDRDFEGQSVLAPSRIDVDRALRFRAVPLRQKTLESPYGDGAIDIPTATGGFTRMRANSAADARQRIGIEGKFVRFLKSAFRNQGDVAAGV